MFVRAKNAFFHARTFCVFEGWVNTNTLEETPTLENAVSRHRLRRNNALLINQFRLYFTFGSGICFIVILTIAFTAVNTVRTAKPVSVNTRILSVGVGGGRHFGGAGVVRLGYPRLFRRGFTGVRKNFEPLKNRFVGF